MGKKTFRQLILSMRYFVGFLAVGIGVAMILRTEWLIENFGTNAWAEDKLGTSGGSRLMYKTLGLILIFFGFLFITNMIGGFLQGTVGKLLVR